MKIIGYSERGAMNALFYGMALDSKENAEAAMKEFLKIASFNEEEINKFDDFNLFIEFSLSEFGSPDLAIIAKTNEGKKEVFFVEAKASCEKNFDLAKQKKHHLCYMKDGKYADGHASNLFFQLRLKNYFFEKEVKNQIIDLNEKLRDSRGRERSKGENGIVNNFVKELQCCEKAHFIAIIPGAKDYQEDNKVKDFPEEMPELPAIHFVTWETIRDTDALKNYVNDTIEFNQSSYKKGLCISQILNNWLKV